MKKVFLLSFICILFAIQFINAATIYGNVYGPDLGLLKYSIIQVNSSPIQNMVAVNGNYSFELPEGGAYEITAIYKSTEITLLTRDAINVNSNGNFIHDLILFDTEDVENITFDENAVINQTVRDSLTIPQTYIYLAIGIFVLLVISVIYLIIKKSKTRVIVKKIKSKEKKIIKTEQISESDETLNKIYSLIKKEKRITQKEIRKQIGMSEAKISLVIAELESRGLVKKIKAGRGNIISLSE